jgi:hypothetical protein
MYRILDRIALAYIRRRLAGCKSRADSADRFADCVMELLSAEVERRNRTLAGWDAARAEKAAVEAFKSFEPEMKHGLRLQ